MQQQHYFELLPLLFGMYKRSFDFRKVITPANSTEVFALLAIIGGLCIALFLPELPIRLIGVCVSVLGGVGYFMLISQRLSETVEYTRKPVSAGSGARRLQVIRSTGLKPAVSANRPSSSSGASKCGKPKSTPTKMAGADSGADVAWVLVPRAVKNSVAADRSGGYRRRLA